MYMHTYSEQIINKFGNAFTDRPAIDLVNNDKHREQ